MHALESFLNPQNRGTPGLRRTRLLLLTALLYVCNFTAHSEILFAERFTYPDGPVIETAASKWRNLTGTPGEIRIANGALQAAEGEFEIVETPLPGEPREDGTLYAGFTVTVSALPSGLGSDFAAFSAANGPRTLGRVFATRTAAQPGKFRIGVSTALGVTAAQLFPTSIYPEDLSLDTPYRVLVRLTLPNIGTTLWINPASEQATSAKSPEGTFPGAIAAFAFRQRLIDGNGMGAVTVDNLVVATTFDEAKSLPAPEPQWQFTTASAGTITITGYTGGGADVTVPETINGMPVTRITGGAFRDKTDLQTMTLPSGLIAIGSQAFSMSGITRLIIPDGVTAIEAETFTHCEKLTHVTLPPTLRSIGQMAFAWTGLSEINIPKTVTTFHSAALMFCPNLTAIRVEADNPNFASVDGVVFNKALTTLRIYPAGRPGNYEIPESVRRVEETAFSGAIHPKILVIPDTVTSLGNAAFQGCTGLTAVRIGRGLATITANAFSACTNLAEVFIPDTVRTIGDSAFGSCPALRSITIPASVRTMGPGVFSNSFSLGGPRELVGLERIYFEGNPPDAGPWPLIYAGSHVGGPIRVYHRAGTTGWQSTFGGQSTVLWDPRVASGEGAPGFRDGKFGFTLTGAPGLPVAVEACTDLTNPVWVRLGTHVLTDGTAPFVDTDSATHPGRFYRFQFP